VTASLGDEVASIDISPLFGPSTPARALADRAILEAASGLGFMIVRGLPVRLPVDAAARKRVLRLFDLPEAEQRRLWRQKFDPARPNVYRGWFPAQPGHPTFKEGIDMGPDLAFGPSVVDASDPLREATPLPPEAALPGWRKDAADWYRAMLEVAGAIMAALARGLGLPERQFDDAFRGGGISTLRLIRYPERSEASLAGIGEDGWIVHRGVRRAITGRPHCDSGFVTLLTQDGVSGLQARRHDGAWVDVPPVDGTLAINFGKVLERWTGSRIRATEHRVVSAGAERCSIPFFYEPRVDAEIAPLPLAGVEAFEPFLYGDHLWASVTKFVEFDGMEWMRPPRRQAASAVV